MQGLTNKGEQFVTQWEVRREKKWSYMFLHGSLYCGLPIAIVFFFVNNHFDLDRMEISRFLNSVGFFLVGGLPIGGYQFRRREKVYQSLLDNDAIVKGIERLSNAKVWAYKNLFIALESNDIVIRNEYFWQNEDSMTPEDIEESLEGMSYFVQPILNNKYFEEFKGSKNIVLQFFERSETVTPTGERIL